MSTFYITPKDSDLMHYGVKGMKWGVRKQIEARKKYSKSSHVLSDKVRDVYRDKLKSLDKKHEREVDGDWGSKKARMLDSRQYKERKTLENEAKRKVREAMLLDAGYSKEEAKEGANWMINKGYNLSFSDDDWMHKI